MKDVKQIGRFGKHSNGDDLWLAILALCALAAVMTSLGCSFGQKRPEPKWAPNSYLYSPIENRCLFINADADRIDCDEPRIYDHVLLPLSDLEGVMKKFQECKEWR